MTYLVEELFGDYVDEPQMVELIKVCEAVELKEAKRRLPPELQGKGIYSSQTIWHYQLETGVNNCEHCKDYGGREFLGSDIRSRFPDHIVYDENFIYVNLHQTLWGKDTCKCFLYRAGMSSLDLDLFQANLSTITGENSE